MFSMTLIGSRESVLANGKLFVWERYDEDGCGDLVTEDVQLTEISQLLQRMHCGGRPK